MSYALERASGGGTSPDVPTTIAAIHDTDRECRNAAVLRALVGR